MTDIFVGEWGKDVYVETGFDLSSATGLEIHFSAPSGGTSFVNSASVSVLASNVTTSACGIFSANKTVKYTINGSAGGQEIDAAGNWKVWLEVDFTGAKHLISNSFKFKAVTPG